MRLRYLILVVAVAIAAAQNPTTQPQISARDVNIPIQTPPLPVTAGSAQVIGNPGNATYFYWIVAKYTVGDASPAGPYIATRVPNTLSGSEYVQVSWAAPTGATSYDVLRTSSAAAPTGACACAVATGVSGTTTNDQSNSTAAYTVTPFNASSLDIDIINKVTGAGASSLYQVQNGVQTPIGGGGTPALPSAAIQFNSSPAGTFTGDAKLTWNNASKSFQVGTMSPFAGADLYPDLTGQASSVFGCLNNLGTDPVLANPCKIIQAQDNNNEYGTTLMVLADNTATVARSQLDAAQYLSYHSGTGSLAFLRGGYYAITPQGTGPVTDAYAVHAAIYTGPASTTTNIGGILVDGSGCTLGTCTNHYGVRVSDRIGGTNIWALWTGRGKVWHGDRLIVAPLDASANTVLTLNPVAGHTGKLISAQVNSVEQFSVTAAGLATTNTLAVTGGSGTLGTFTGGAATGANDVLRVTDTANNTGNGYLGEFESAANSAINGVRVNCGSGSTATRAISSQNNGSETFTADCQGNITANSLSLNTLTLSDGYASAPLQPIPAFRWGMQIYCDYMNGLTGCPDASSTSGAGAAVAAVVSDAANHPGLVELSTGTTTTGRAAIGQSTVVGASPLILGGGTVVYDAIVKIPTLSDATERYIIRLGLCDAVGADCTDGAYFEYDESASANWRCKTASNSVRTTNTSTTAVAAATYVRLTIVVNAAGTSVAFYLDGVEVTGGSCSPIATNIPTGASRATGWFANILKSAGTTARTAWVDYQDVRQVFTSQR